jgi:hypothetical protein
MQWFCLVSKHGPPYHQKPVQRLGPTKPLQSSWNARPLQADGSQDRWLVGKEQGHCSTLRQLEVDRQNQLYLGMIQKQLADHSRPLVLVASFPGGEQEPG